MQGSMWKMLLYVALAGAVGGLGNAALSEDGFILPKRDKTLHQTVLRPGYLGNVLIGAIGAVVSWGLYGPLSSALIAGTPEAFDTNITPDKVGLSLASLVGALLVGVAGARGLTNEVEKNLFRAAASEAADATASPTASKQIAGSTGSTAITIAKNMRRDPLSDRTQEATTERTQRGTSVTKE